jgi:hypothetical protein
VEGIYWLILESDQLNADQQAHPDCGEFYVAVELEGDRLVCELLVRSAQRIRCSCIQYADAEQSRWVIGIIDAILDKLDIHV